MCKQYYQSNLNPCGLADNYVVPEWNVIHGGVLKLPEHVSYEEAALLNPLHVVFVLGLNSNIKKMIPPQYWVLAQLE